MPPRCRAERKRRDAARGKKTAGTEFSPSASSPLCVCSPCGKWSPRLRKSHNKLEWSISLPRTESSSTENPPQISLPRMGIAAGSPSAERIGCGVLAATHPLSCGSGAYMRWKAAIPPTRQPFCSEIPEIAKTKNRPAEAPSGGFLTLFPCARRAAHARLSVQHSRTGKPHTPKRLRQDRHAAFPPLRQMRLAAELSLSP